MGIGFGILLKKRNKRQYYDSKGCPHPVLEHETTNIEEYFSNLFFFNFHVQGTQM